MLGTWVGNYRFNNDTHQKLIGFEKTFFEIIITASDGRKFSGTVQDDLSTGGTEGKGIIEGEINGSRVTFIKKMPVLTFLNPKTGKRITRRKSHSLIMYLGTLSEDKKSISGDWKFKNRIYWYGLFPIITSKSSGTWEMAIK